MIGNLAAAPALPMIDTAAADAPPLVIIADDQAPLREALTALFETVGTETLCFASAADLLGSVLPDRPGCFILDVRMPGLSGLELQLALGAHHPPMPVIFLTGHGDVPMSIRAMKAGAFEFKTKPVRDPDLIDVTMAALQADLARRAALRQARAGIARFARLSPRERQVLGLLAKGLLNKQIAHELGIMEVTVKLHRGGLMKKMGATSVAQVVSQWEQLPPDTRR